MGCSRLRKRCLIVSVVLAATVATARHVAAADRDTTDPQPVLANSTVDLESLQKAFETLAERVAPSVVTIRAARQPDGAASTTGSARGARRSPEGRRTYGAGSGVIIRSDGMILTNQHVIQRAEEILIRLHDGTEHVASIVQSDRRSDLAVLQIGATDLQPALMGDVADLRQGHLVFAMGNPFGHASDMGSAWMSWGVVSALHQQLPLLGAADDRYYGNLIVTTASIIPGNSGGPLFDIRGRLAGIVTAISTRTGRSGKSEGVGFAVPISRRTRKIIDQLVDGQDVEYGFLGVLVRTPDDTERAVADVPRNRGALVDTVDPDSPAHRARIKPGDIVYKVDGQEVFSADHLVRMVGCTPPGQKIVLTLHRGDRVRNVEATLTRREPTDAERAGPIHWRGLTLVPLGRDQAGNLKLDDPPDTEYVGLLVTYVRPNSSAERAGLRDGMVLRTIQEVQATSPLEVRRLIRRLRGSPVELVAYGGRRFELQP